MWLSDPICFKSMHGNSLQENSMFPSMQVVAGRQTLLELSHPMRSKPCQKALARAFKAKATTNGDQWTPPTAAVSKAYPAGNATRQWYTVTYSEWTITIPTSEQWGCYNIKTPGVITTMSSLVNLLVSLFYKAPPLPNCFHFLSNLPHNPFKWHGKCGGLTS